MFKIIHHHWNYRWERFYSKNRWHLVLELSLLTVIIVLISLVIGLNVYHPKINSNLTALNPLINIPIDINNPPLDLSVSLATSSIDIKDGAILKLSFKNNSVHPINDLKFSYSVLSKDFTIDHLELQDKNNLEISLNRTELSFPSLPANLNGEISLKVYFKNKNNSSNKEINWQISSSYSVAGQLLKYNLDLPIVYLNSVLNVDARAYYNSPQGDQLGSGPLPPLVGLPTNYWIFIEAKSDGNFNNFIYSAKLPKGVELVVNRSILSGTFNYNKDTRQIIWRIPIIEANSSDYRASFEVQLIPRADQADDVLPLLISAHFSAQESAGLKQKINLELINPSTNLNYDLINKGQGKVIK